MAGVTTSCPGSDDATVRTELYNDTGALPATRVPTATAMPVQGQAGGAAGVLHADAAPPAAVVASGTSWPTADALVRAEAQLAVLRANGARIPPIPSPSRTCCPRCGVSRAKDWVHTERHWGTPGHQRMYLCGSCVAEAEAVVDAAGSDAVCRPWYRDGPGPRSIDGTSTRWEFLEW